MDIRRLLLVLVFSFSSFMLWQKWTQYNAPKPPAAAAASRDSVPAAPAGDLPQPTAATVAGAVPSPAIAAPAAAAAQLITLNTDVYTADISTVGGDIVRLEFKNYAAAGDKAAHFALFDAKHRYVAQSGLIGAGLPNHHSTFVALPGPRQLADGADKVQLSLEATGANGVKLTKTYTFTRGSYRIGLTQAVTNGSSQPLAANGYYQFQRDNVKPEGESRMVSTFTGPAVYTAEHKYQKISFDDIAKEKAKFANEASDGWLAMVQHYFVAAWVPAGSDKREFYARKLEDANGSTPMLASAGVILPLGQVAPGARAEQSLTLYAGPQEQARLKETAEGLDLVVDYGWLTLIAAPIFWVLEAIHKLVGNWGWAIILLTVGIKAIFYPLSAASYKSMAKMRAVTPRLQQLKERYGDDRARLNQEMMKLYQTEKINPLGGCLPVVVQIPVFISLYWVLLGAVEMRGAPWMMWITDLSTADPFYVLPVIMVASMLVQTRLNPTPPDPIQAKVMMVMPFMFGVMFFWFPSGLVLYWVVNNVLSIAQQWRITRVIEGAKKAA